MRKNGSREISFSQYRTTDLFLFAIIVALAEFLAFGATVWFPQEAIFSFSFLLPLVLVVMMRWGWPSVFYVMGGGALFCALHSLGWQYYLSYIFGNAAVCLALAYLLPIGKDKVAKNVWLSLGMVIIAWVAQVLVRAGVLAATGEVGFVSALAGFCGIASDCGLLSLAMGLIAIVIVRRFDGLFEDQKSYLIRLGKIREEKRKIDTFGEDLGELDEESLSILNQDNDLY